MTRRTRAVVFVPFGAALLAGLLVAMLGLPDFGDGHSAYGAFVAHRMVADRGTTDVVAPVTFDLRAFDTLGEELILFAAGAACSLLLRGASEGRAGRRAEQLARVTPAIAGASLRGLALALVAPTFVLGAAVVSHGQVTPGGGFQGGVIVATVTLLLFCSGRAALLRKAHAVSLAEVLDGAGAAAFGMLGIGGLVFATALFENFLGPGMPGDVISGGTIALANVAVGFEVAAAFALIFIELLDQALVGDDA